MYKKTVHIIFITLALGLLLTPSIVMFTGLEGNYSNDENRKMQNFPEFQMAYPVQFVREFKLYFNDNFGFRIAFFNLYKMGLKNLFDEDPLPRKVVSGKNGWYFLGDEHNNVVSKTIGANQFSKTELNNIASKLVTANTWLEQNGIRFFVAVAPNKHTIYSQYLPFSIHNKKTKFSVLKEFLDAKHDFELIDLKEPILKAKDTVQLYYKNDSHWNDYGAYLGYVQLMNVISEEYPEVKALSNEQIKIR